MLSILRGLTLFMVVSAVAAAYLGNGVYHITNDKGNTIFRSAVYGLTCYVTNSTGGEPKDLNELWLVREVYRAPGVYTLQNLAHQAFVSVNDDNLITLYSDARGAFIINDLGDGSYSIKAGPKAWAAQPPITYGFVKIVEYNGQDASQKWRFESALYNS